MVLLMGIDWSQDQHNVRIHNQAGGLVVRFQMAHSPTGFAKLDEQIDKLGVPPANSWVALETAHNLLVDFLWSRGYQAYVIAPSIVNKSRGRYTSSGAHDDDRDAFILAELLRTDRHRFAPWKPDGLLVRQMRAKLSWVDALTKSITRYSNRLHAVLQRYYPQMGGVFSDLQTQICLQFIRHYPTPQAACALTYAEFAAFCHEQGYTCPSLIPERYATLLRAGPEPDPVVALTLQDEATFLAEVLLRLVQQKNCLRALARRTIPQLNTPFDNPPEEPVTEVEVTDPTHPLFGRRFSLLSVSSSPQAVGHALVTYRDHIVLRIPLISTNLAPSQPSDQVKLTLSALTELISLAEQCEVLCHTDQVTSGNDCHRSSKTKSSTTCRQSSKR